MKTVSAAFLIRNIFRYVKSKMGIIAKRINILLKDNGTTAGPFIIFLIIATAW